MKSTTTQFLKACSLSVALLGSAAFVLSVALPDAAYADNGKGNGGGNGKGGGNGGGKGNGGGNDNASAKSGGNGKSSGGSSSSSSNSKSSKAAEKSKAAKKKVAKSEAPEAPEPTEVGEQKAAKIKPKHIEGDGIAHPSELGALNAAHANPRALENAAPNSRVGRIAAYRDAVLDGQALAEDLAEKTALRDTLDMPDRSVAEIDEALVDANAEVVAKADAVTLLEEELAAAGGSDPAIEADLEIARDALTEAENAAQALEDERAAAEAYETLTDEITELTQKVEDQPLVERTALEAAANKPVTDDVEATVKLLLGL